MLEPELVAKIVKKISSSIKKPLTVKIRKGFNDQNINAVKIAQIAEDNGAAAITVHGRTREQYYSGTTDYEIIKQVKKAVKIPVIGNGDVFSPVDAEKLFNYTECDAIMIGRGAKGNPWIFSSILHYQKTKEILPNPPIDVIINTIIKHTNMMIQLKGEFIGIREMRKHFAWYTKGLKNSANLRNLINQTNNYNEFKKIVEELSNYISL